MSDDSVVQDTISTSFAVEELIVSDTVKVTLSITKVHSDESAFDLKTVLRTVFDVDWAIVSLTRYEDTSGLERIDATAVARIPEHKANGINKKVNEVSRAGLKISILGLDNSPERNKIDKVNESLRARIYKLAQVEADTANSAISKVGNPWRVGLVDFGRVTGIEASAANYTRAVSLASAIADAPEQGTDLSYKVSLSANVKLVRLASK